MASKLETKIEKLNSENRKVAVWLLKELHNILICRNNDVCPRDYAIYEVIWNVARKSFVQFSDENYIWSKIAWNYFAKDGSWIDQIAQSASFRMGWEWDEINTEDVIEFIKKYPWWSREFVRKNCTNKTKDIVNALRDYDICIVYTRNQKIEIQTLLQDAQIPSSIPNSDIPF